MAAKKQSTTVFTHLYRSLLIPTLLGLGASALSVAQVAKVIPQPPDRESTGPAALKNLTLEELAELEVVTVSKEPFPAFRTPAAIYILTQEDIRRSSATSLPEALRLVPGVHVAQIDSNKWAIGIRGFQGRLSKAMRVLIDGRSIYTPLFAGVYWEMHHVMLEDVERIEVVRGPGATVWGSNAVNGVINIITKSAHQTRGMLVSAAAGNVEQGQFSWRYGAGNERLSARIYGTGFTRAPQLHPDDRNFDDWRMGQVGFRADWTASDRDLVTLQGDAYSTIAGQKLVISRFSEIAAPAVEDNGFYSGQNLRMLWRRKLSGGSDMQLNGYFDRTDRQDLNYREQRQQYDVDFIHHVPLKRRHDIIWGAGARISPSEFFQTRETVDFRPHHQTYNIFSGFLQDEIALVPDRLAFTLGTKIEHNSFSGFEWQPSGRLSWTPDRRNTLWGAVTRAVRTPSRIEEGFEFNALFFPQLPLYVRLIGDGGFNPEQLIGYEFGYRRYFQKAGFISLAAFHNRYDDLLSVESQQILAITDPPPQKLVLPLLFRNGVQGTTSGMEVWGLVDVKPWWRLRGFYSYMGLNARRQVGSNDASTVGQLEGDSPAHTALVQTSFNLPGAMEADLTWRYVGDLPNQNVPSYQTGDVRVARRLTRELDIAIVGRNLLQPSHAEYGGNPGPLVRIRRSAYLKLTWTR